MQTELLERYPDANLRVYAVWLPFVNGTSDATTVSQRVLPDRRVVQFWDGGSLTSSWFAQQVEHSQEPAWDVFYLYGPTARWTDAAGPLLGSGATIIGNTAELTSAITPLLAEPSG